jgi:predicted transcriptional regulator
MQELRRDLQVRETAGKSDGLFRSQRREVALAAFDQPLTATHLAKKTALPLMACCETIRALVRNGFLECLNDPATMSRVYWLTHDGARRQKQTYRANSLEPPNHFVPNVDWTLYGTLCTSHRSAVIRHLSWAMQPSQLKRKAVFSDPFLTMSANNCRDVLRYLLAQGVVEPVRKMGVRHPLYQLTEAGKQYRELLMRAHMPRW